MIGEHARSYIVAIAPQLQATARESLYQGNTKVVIAEKLEILDFRLSVQKQVCTYT